ncbi:hypothetical protein F5Y15DRAFT_239119 [Xylariaceae sp. FL0016]|nr:hypothetical protein F5Y15DRAFT_239119 [Xylariaceae sp. FL0016]
MSQQARSRWLVPALILSSFLFLGNYWRYLQSSPAGGIVSGDLKVNDLNIVAEHPPFQDQVSIIPAAKFAQIEWGISEDDSSYEIMGIGGFRSHVEVASIDIKAKRTSTQQDPPVLERLPVDFPGFSKVDLYGEPERTGILDIPELKIEVNVAPPLPVPDASEIVFGGATTLNRLNDSLDSIRHWAAGTGARLVIVTPEVELPPTNDNDSTPRAPSAAEVIQAYAAAGIKLSVVESAGDWVERYVSLLDILPSHVRHDSTRWVGLIDDDTFFFSTRALLRTLHKYDAGLPQWVGAHSEYAPWLWAGGLNCVGGAGVFLSIPLLAQLRGKAADCLALSRTHGDKALSLCIYKHTTTKLSVEHGLHQLEMFGDPSGFYEAVRPQPLSAHHWKSWHWRDMAAVARVARVCGDACVLQSFRFADGWLMTNGYSVVRYGYSDEELAAQNEFDMEHSWDNPGDDDDDEGSWRYSLGPLRPKDRNKVQFQLARAVEDADRGTVTLLYVKRTKGIGEGVVQVVWRT